MAIPNPFRTRHSEAAARDAHLFTSTFGPEILSVIPPPPFNQFYVIRSAPGAGKTSMMKALTPTILYHVHENRTRLSSLHSFLEDYGVIDDIGPVIMGVLENLQVGYSGFADLAIPDELRTRLLFRLIDSRIMQGCVRAALTLSGGSSESDPARVEIRPQDAAVVRALDRLGGSSGAGIIRAAEGAEDELLDLFDQLILDDEVVPIGHSRLYSIMALSGSEIWVDDEPLRARPLIMLDDVHTLERHHRDAVLSELGARSHSIGRWVATRSIALTDDELLGAGVAGRDYDVIEVEALAREKTAAGSAAKRLSGQTLSHHRFRKMLLDIADKRAGRVLDRLLPDNRTLTDLLSLEPEASLGGEGNRLVPALRRRIETRASQDARYAEWFEGTVELEGRDGAARLAELEVLIERDSRRTQGELFSDFSLGLDELGRRGSSSLREAAFLRVCNEFGLPYYTGPDTFARLGSANIEQFLEICGDLTAKLISQDAMGRALALSAEVQDRVVRDASREYYRSLVNLPDGDLVVRFVDAVGKLSLNEAKKPTLPYPPGVTGTALSMNDRSRLRDLKSPSSVPGALELRSALVSAIANNVVWIELDYRVKNGRFMVIYLNRLLCPRFDMPLGLGGFRERHLSEMARWMITGDEYAASSQGSLL